MRVMKTSVLLLLLLAIAFCQPVMAKPEKAAEPVDVLSLLPDSTLGMIIVNKPGDLFEKVVGLAKKLGAPIPKNPLAELKKDIAALKYVDPTRPAVIAITQKSGVGPMPVYFIGLVPVKNFTAFVKAAGGIKETDGVYKIEYAFAAEYKGYAVLVDPNGAGVLETIGKNEGRIATEFAPMRERMEAADVSGGATRQGIEMLTAFAKMGISTMQMQFENMPPDPNTGMSPKSISQALSIYTLMFDELNNSVQTYAFATSIEKDAIVSDDIIRLKNKKLAETLAKIDPFDTESFKGLPAGRPFVAFAGAMPKSLMSGLMVFSKKGMLAMSDLYGLDEKGIDELIARYQPLMEKTNSMAFVMGAPRKKGSIYSGMCGISRVEGGAEQYIADNAALFENMNEIMKKSKNGAMIGFGKPKKIEVDGRPGISVKFSVNMEVAPEGSMQQAQMDEIMERMFGKGGKTTIFFVAIDENTVAYAYDSPALIKRVIAGDDAKTLGSVQGYEETLALLPEDAQWIGVFDLGGYMELIKKVVPPNQLPPGIKVPPSPFAMGATVTKDEVCIRSVVTVKTIKRIVKSFQRISQIQRQEPLMVPDTEALPAPNEEVVD